MKNTIYGGICAYRDQIQVHPTKNTRNYDLELALNSSNCKKPLVVIIITVSFGHNSEIPKVGQPPDI